MTNSQATRPINNSAQLLSTEEAPPEWVFEQWLSMRGIHIVYAKQGVGKSYFALALSHAIAKKHDYLGFSIAEPKTVCYFDMENDPALALERHKQVDRGTGCRNFKGSDFALIRRNSYEHVPNLREPIKRNKYLIDSTGYDVVIIDNYKATAFDMSDRDNEVMKFNQCLPVLDAMVNRGQCVVLMHHENKSGDIAGSQRMLDVATTVTHLHKIYFKLPSGIIYGTRLRLEKGRNLKNDTVERFLRWITTEDSINWRDEDMDLVYIKVIQEYRLKTADQVSKVFKVDWEKAYSLLEAAASVVFPSGGDDYGDFRTN